MTRRYKALIITVIALVFLFVILPYLVPISNKISTVSTESLVSPSGKFISVNDINIYIEEHGPVTGETIVLLHGFGGSTFTWRNNVTFFANHGYHTISLDLKGFGLSYRDYKSDYSHKAQAAIVDEVLQNLNVKQVYLVGHSMGSSVMFHFAHLYPNKVLGLISVDGAITLAKSSQLPGMLLGFPPFNRAGRDILTLYINKERLGNILASAYYRKEIVTQELTDGYYDRAIRSGWYDSLLAMTRDMPKNMIDFALDSLVYPTLIIRGDNDTWVTQDNIDIWKDKIPDAKFTLIKNTGHLPMEEQPDMFNEIVLEFLLSTKI